MLNEIKYSNLEKFSNLSLFQLMSKNPVEVLRVLFYYIENKDLNIVKESKMDAIKLIRGRLNDSLSKENPWLSASNNVSFELDIDSMNIRFRFLYEKRDSVRVEVQSSMYGGVSKTLNLQDKSSTVFENMSEIVYDILEARKKIEAAPSNQKMDVHQREHRKMKKKHGDSDIDLKILNKIASKYFLKLSDVSDARDEKINITPFFPNYNKIVSKVYGESRYNRSIDFKFSFQIEMLQKFIPILDKKLKNRNILIQDFRLTDSYVSIYITDQPANKIKSGDYTYGDHNKHSLKRVESMDLSKFESMSFDEFQKNLVSGIFKVNE